MSRRKHICREIIEQMSPDVVRRADRLLAKLLVKCPQAKADGAEKVKFTADPDVLRVLATYASFGHRAFIDSMKDVLEERQSENSNNANGQMENDRADGFEFAQAGDEIEDPDMVDALDELNASLFD
jgi:hypothetical protein